MNDIILLGLAGVAILALFLILRGMRANRAADRTLEEEPHDPHVTEPHAAEPVATRTD